MYSRISAKYGWIKAQIDTFSSGGVNPPPPKFTGVCYNFPGSWWDEFGLEYNCEWYANENYCEIYGSDFANGGLTANEVCCVCGGGEIFDGNSPSKAPTPPTLPPSPAPSPSPTSSPTRAPAPPTPSPIPAPTKRSPSKAPSLATTVCINYISTAAKIMTRIKIS